jgi:ATP-dependent 26S proteasome regulatory subunit
MLVEKVAAEAEFSLLSISPSMILSKWAGDSEKAVSRVFDLARTMQPSILFLVSVHVSCSLTLQILQEAYGEAGQQQQAEQQNV